MGAKCSTTRKQAFKTGLIANDILMDLSAESNQFSEAYKDQLRMIIDQIAYRNPHFSAGGVFSVDYAMVSCLATTIVTYITVLLQLRGNPTCHFTINGTAVASQ